VSLQDDFPNLDAEGYSQTSPATEDYNCIAWAAGRQDDWWRPDPAFVSYWPEQAPRAETLDAFDVAFASLGYQPCADGRQERGVEKIALYALNGKTKHAARQLSDGSWTSKLGEGLDISHSLRGLEGPLYGQVVAYMRRPSNANSPAEYVPSRFKGWVFWLVIFLTFWAAFLVLSYLARR